MERLTEQEAKRIHTPTKLCRQALHFFEDHDDYFAKPVLKNALAIFLAPKREEGRTATYPYPPS